MSRSKGAMASLLHVVLVVVLSLIAHCRAGPLGPLPNVTSMDLGLKEGECAVGDVVYASGEQFPGAALCERCTCAGGAVRCERARCEPRPGCKALHRPDHCCPTYQCECEQEGRVYSNGEKLVDPADPCRVCYCQGGEVVCRRIACFLRDDCSPRLVPGRCCPEYDNCPLRGVTTIPGVTPIISSGEEMVSSLASLVPKETVKQEITIKEITPVSEIPVITEVKIKEILPSPAIEVPDYSSSKSPLIVREATSETTITEGEDSKTEMPYFIKAQTSASPVSEPSTASEVSTKLSETVTGTKTTYDSPPSKVSLSTQDSINSEIYPSIVTSAATLGSPSITPEVAPVTGTTKSSVVEEEDTSLFDHNPAFPPLPDDLSVLSNHDDEIAAEQTADAEHISVAQEHSSAAIVPPTTSAPPVASAATPALPDTAPEVTQQKVETSTHIISNNDLNIANDVTTANSQSIDKDVSSVRLETTAATETTKVKDSPMLNLRSAIPTEILNIPSLVPEDINGELDEVADSTTGSADTEAVSTSTATDGMIKIEEKATKVQGVFVTVSTSPDTTPVATEAYVTTTTIPESTIYLSSSHVPQLKEDTVKSNIVTEITAQTEFSSIPIETSDQNPQENSEKDRTFTFTVDPSPPNFERASTRMSTPHETEVITVSRATTSNIDGQFNENIETTEFVLTLFGSSETVTDTVELIKISAEPDKSAAIIEPEQKKNSVLTDLINLVGDVASIGDQTDSPEPTFTVTPAPTPTAVADISDSEELIPVNAGYKSKNNNWNLNSITEVPVKSKSSSPAATKQKVVEIEGEDTDTITDASPPHDRAEPTTRRPHIDNVTDDARPGQAANNTDNKDIEIITKSYVPTINRRPTKVILKKSTDSPAVEQTATGEPAPATAETSTAAASDPPAPGPEPSGQTTEPAPSPSTIVH